MDLRSDKVDFIRWLEAQNKREKSYGVPNTLAAYDRTIEHFLKFIAPTATEVDPAVVSRLQVEEFIVSGQGEDGKGVAPRTVNQRLAAIRALQASGLRVRAIADVTPVPHNGCRPPKKRRV